jgi:hypothetical protein
MTCRMAKKPIPWPTPTVKLQVLQPSGASLIFRIVNPIAALDVSSRVAKLNPKPARILAFRCGREEGKNSKIARLGSTAPGEFRVQAGEPVFKTPVGIRTLPSAR